MLDILPCQGVALCHCVNQCASGFGDLVAVRGDPLDDMGVMKDVSVVIKGGLVFRLEAPK
jgi:hypothetical protein